MTANVATSSGNILNKHLKDIQTNTKNNPLENLPHKFFQMSMLLNLVQSRFDHTLGELILASPVPLEVSEFVLRYHLQTKISLVVIN